MRSIMILLLLFAVACTSATPAASKVSPAEISSLARATGEFGLSLFSRLAAEDAGKNLCLSPLSIQLALLMPYLGAKGATAKAIDGTLRLEGMDAALAAQTARAYLDDIKDGSNGVELLIANSIWHRPDLVCQPDFLRLAGEVMQAGVHKLDFSRPEAASRINDWIADKTKNMITKVIDSISDRMMMYLVNAIFFHGSWTASFDKAQTQDEPFTKEDGSRPQVPLMRRVGKFYHYADAQAAAVELPYGKGRFAMLAILPAQGKNMRSYLESLNWAELSRIRQSLRQKDGEVGVPRFSISWGVKDLVAQLKALGMGVAFSGQADFSGISGKTDLTIDTVLHKAVIEVDEKGTKAAATTVVGMKMTSLLSSEETPFQFIADRPFVFIILDKKTGMPVFAGVVHSPEA